MCPCLRCGYNSFFGLPVSPTDLAFPPARPHSKAAATASRGSVLRSSVRGSASAGRRERLYYYSTVLHNKAESIMYSFPYSLVVDGGLSDCGELAEAITPTFSSFCVCVVQRAAAASCLRAFQIANFFCLLSQNASYNLKAVKTLDRPFISFACIAVCAVEEVPSCLRFRKQTAKLNLIVLGDSHIWLQSIFAGFFLAES